MAAHALVGTWAGTWTDTVFKVSGSLNAAITQSGKTLSGTGSIGINSLNIGMTTASGTGTGTVEGDTVTFTFLSAPLGSGSGSSKGTLMTGSGSVIQSIGFGNFTFSGTIEAGNNKIKGSFNFPTGGNGTAEVTRQ